MNAVERAKRSPNALPNIGVSASPVAPSARGEPGGREASARCGAGPIGRSVARGARSVVIVTALIRYTAMIEAAVTISLRVLRARRGRLWATSVVPLLTRGTTLTIISKPVRPRAIWGNDQRAMRSQGQ